MSSDSDKSRLEQYREENRNVQNSDAGLSEKMETASEIEEKYYDSKWEKIRDEAEERSDFNKYASLLIGGLLSGLIGLILFSNSGLGFVVFGIGGVLLASVFVTEPGIKFGKTMGEIAEAMNDPQKQNHSTSTSESKIICSECGWQNPQRNNYCNDCGEGLGNS